MTAPTQDAPRSVIVELTPAGRARMHKAPPGTMVMVVESTEITSIGKRSLAAGGRCSGLADGVDQLHDKPEPRQVTVSFPG